MVNDEVNFNELCSYFCSLSSFGYQRLYNFYHLQFEYEHVCEQTHTKCESHSLNVKASSA